MCKILRTRRSYFGETEMANVCSEYKVHGCPASYYLNCPAYAAGKNCWEAPRKPCCKVAGPSECVDCEVYRRGKASLENNDRAVEC